MSKGSLPTPVPAMPPSPVLAAAAAFALAGFTASRLGRRLDRKLYRLLNRGAGPAADRAFTALTELGSIWASVGAAAALWRFGRRREAEDALGAALAMWALGQLAKRMMLRPRPYHALPEVRLMIAPPRGTSWPSSHPAVLSAFATVAARDLGATPPVRAALAGVVAAVGASRVYLGVHYPGDVAGGLLLGRAASGMWSRLASPRILGRPVTVAP